MFLRKYLISAVSCFEILQTGWPVSSKFDDCGNPALGRVIGAQLGSYTAFGTCIWRGESNDQSTCFIHSIGYGNYDCPLQETLVYLTIPKFFCEFKIAPVILTCYDELINNSANRMLHLRRGLSEFLSRPIPLSSSRFHSSDRSSSFRRDLIVILFRQPCYQLWNRVAKLVDYLGSGEPEVGCIVDISDFETTVGICSFARWYFVFVEVLTRRQRMARTTDLLFLFR